VRNRHHQDTTPSARGAVAKTPIEDAETGFLKHSPSGVPYLDWGGQGPVLHFAHANGFPPGTYSSFVARLTDRFHVLGMEARALWGTHDPRQPCHSASPAKNAGRSSESAAATDSPNRRPQGTGAWVQGHEYSSMSTERSSGPRRAEYSPAQFRHWRELADDLAPFLGELKLDGIIGAGHSLGAVTTLLCAVANPRLFRALVLIDPVIVPAQMAPVVAAAVSLGLSSRTQWPVGARRRRTDWPDREALYRAYRAAPVFARWQDAFLRDYVASGTVPNSAGGLRLRYPPEWEARIFETVPADVWLSIPRLRHMPLLVVRGEHSTTYRRDAMRFMRWLLPQGTFVEIAGADHFVPMSRPEETAAAIKAFVGQLQSE